MDPLESLTAALVELDEIRTRALTKEILALGQTTSFSIMHACQQAMTIVGERYERREYYLSALILAGELFKEVSDLVQPEQDQVFTGNPVGKVILGTVAGDIHDIGKNIFGAALRADGFVVADLGVDVPSERFLLEVRRFRPDLVCLSGVITSAFSSMKETVEMVREHGAELGYVPPVILGGGMVDSYVCRYTGADSWSTDAMEGVRICQRFVSERATVSEG